MDKIIAELPKGPLDKLVISLREYQGHPFITSAYTSWRMTMCGDRRNGVSRVTISPSQWEEFMTALGRVAAHLPADGSPRPPKGRRG